MENRPKILIGITWLLKTGCGKIYLTINPPAEISIWLGKTGGCPAARLGVIWRLADLIMRLGGTLEEIQGELSGIQRLKNQLVRMQS